MGIGAGLYMYDVVVEKFTFAVSSPDEFLSKPGFQSLVIETKCHSVYICE